MQHIARMWVPGFVTEPWSRIQPRPFPETTSVPVINQPQSPSAPPAPKLDDADRKMIELLLKDGRMSGREIAQGTGLSEANVSRRLARLIEDGAVRIIGLVEPYLLGLKTRSIVLLKCNGDCFAIAERLAKLPSVYWCGVTFGEYDLVLFVVAKDDHDLLACCDSILESERGISVFVNCHMLETIHSNGEKTISIDQNSTKGLTRHAAKLDEVDHALIRMLQVDGRTSFADLAAAADISATSAADRYRQLSQSGIVQLITLPNPISMGTPVRFTACITVNGPIRQAMRAIANLPNCVWSCGVGGVYAIITEFHCEDETCMNHIRAKLANIPGVTSVGISLHRRVVLDSFCWGHPEQSHSL